jgi:hypothetical protein
MRRGEFSWPLFAPDLPGGHQIIEPSGQQFREWVVGAPPRRQASPSCGSRLSSPPRVSRCADDGRLLKTEDFDRRRAEKHLFAKDLM